MRETIQELYGGINDIAVGYLFYHSRKNIEEIKELVPNIQKFTEWFLKENRIGVEEDFYQDMCRNLLFILEDISVAMLQQDRVLLHDALAYGMLEYLRIFVPEGDDADGAV